MTDAADAWFDAAPAQQLDALRALRALFLEAVPSATESIKWRRPCYAVHGKLFCYLAHAKQHVTIGFQSGAHLDDPEGLLDGTGKDHRHVKVAPPYDLPTDALRDMITTAAGR